MEIEDNRNEGRTKGVSATMKKERKRCAHIHTQIDREEINGSSGKRSHSDGRRRSEREKGRDIWRGRRGRSEETP